MKDINLITEGDINISVSREQWNKSIESEETLKWLERDAESFYHQSLSTPCLDVLESCEGIFITDVSGKKYMDFHGNNVHQVGHRNPFVIEKVKQQLDILPFAPRRFTNKPAIELAEKLSSLLPGDLNRVLFTPGGTSAVGMALKLAKVVTGKHKVVSFVDSFHGASLDAIAVGGEAQFKKYMGTLYPETKNIPQPIVYRNSFKKDIHYAEALESLLKEDNQIGAFIAETIRNTDVQIPSKEYWKRIREICTKYNVLLILDEIPIAFGRTGKMFAFEHYDIEPDIICLGKGLGAGVIPLAAIVSRNDYNVASDISLGHYTHEKNPLGSVAALAMLEFIDSNNLLEKVTKDELFVKEKMITLTEKYSLIGDVRGIGLLWGIELVKDRETKEKAINETEQIMYECLKNGLSFKVSQGNVIQFCPPLIIEKEHLESAFKILENAIHTLGYPLLT